MNEIDYLIENVYQIYTDGIGKSVIREQSEKSKKELNI